jgi:hypothetical protein
MDIAGRFDSSRYCGLAVSWLALQRRGEHGCRCSSSKLPGDDDAHDCSFWRLKGGEDQFDAHSRHAGCGFLRERACLVHLYRVERCFAGLS